VFPCRLDKDVGGAVHIESLVRALSVELLD
jgi:hypothetical protein